MRWVFIAMPLLSLAAACGATIPDVVPQEPGSGPPGGATVPGTMTPGAPPPRSAEEFVVSVRAQRDSYDEGELVVFEATACNQSSATTTEGGGGSELPYSFEVLDDAGTLVADDSHAMRTTELIIVPWGPGQCRTVTGTWDQHHWNRPDDRPSEPPEIVGTPVRGDRVPSGAYRIHVHTSVGSATSDHFVID